VRREGAHLILGAGCAGLSLACALLDAGVGEQIVLVDRRTSFDHDRTWCFWSTSADLPFASLATHRWPSWRMVGRDGRATYHHSSRHPYLHLPANRLYAAALSRLDGAANVELRLGERVLDVFADDDCASVRTSLGTIEGSVAYDAMGGAGPLNRERPQGAIELRQRFLGLEVEVERPVLDPSTVTLMDFRAASGAGDSLRFMYVLPFSPTRALVEDTSLGGGTVGAPERRAAITRYLREVLGAGALQVRREERGTLPMTTHSFPLTRGPRLFAVGAAAGALRPSSGYAFVRMQRHVQGVARAIAAGGPPPSHIGHRRHRLLDSLFLRTLTGDPAGFDRHLLALARGVDAGAFARFMTDTSGLRDEAAVVASLARPDFLRAMAVGAPGCAAMPVTMPVPSV
jgi:lycopene beta-cyclase